MDDDGAYRRAQRLHLAEKIATLRVPVLQDGDDGGDLLQLVEERGSNSCKRGIVARLQARQHVQHVFEIRQAASGADLVNVRAGGQNVHDVLSAAEVVGDGGDHRDRRFETWRVV